jgi:hypothetical protein
VIEDTVDLGLTSNPRLGSFNSPSFSAGLYRVLPFLISISGIPAATPLI